VHKFAGRVIPNPDFKITPLFDVEYLTTNSTDRLLYACVFVGNGLEGLGNEVG